MAEASPIFTTFLTILFFLVIYWFTIGQKKHKELFEGKK